MSTPLHPRITGAVLTVILAFAGALAAQDAQPPARRVPLAVSVLEPGAPLTIEASATPESLIVRVRIEEGWHLYGRDTGGGQPVEIGLLEGSCFSPDGKLRTPMDAKGEMTGEAVLTLPIRRTAAGGTLRARFKFTVCDALRCLPPMEAELSGDLSPASGAAPTVLLVATARDERSARIAAFLEGHGFRTVVTTYDAVTREECDSRDVVLADSPLFDQTKGARQHALKFPETKAPIVAVGFLGTVLLEAQQVAMACGYI